MPHKSVLKASSCTTPSSVFGTPSARRYDAYRHTDVEWLQHVPKHWKVRRLKFICRFAYGDSLPSEDREVGDIAVHGSNGAVGTHSQANSRAPVIVIGRKGSHGEVNFSDDSVFAIDTTYYVDERHTSADCRWLYYALLCADLRDVSMDSAVPGLSRDHAYQKRLPVPHLTEQHAIARFLDRETGRIDGLVEKKRLLIERLEEYRTALITRTVTRGLPPEAARAAELDPSPRLKASGVDWLGDVPAHWEVARLKWSSSGAVNGVWGDEPDGENDIACVRVADFDRRNFGVNLDDPTLRAISRSQRAGRELRRGDLLLEKSGGGDKQPVGCVVLFDYDEPAVSSNFIARVATIQGASPRFWVYVHAALYSGKLNYPAIKQTTGIQNLDSDAYFNTPAAFPPAPEQEAIASFLDRETAAIDRLHHQIGIAIERLQEHRTALVTAAVTGKIDVRDEAPIPIGPE